MPYSLVTPQNKVPSRGPERADILIVGEAPGAQEERLRQPFIGPSGQLLEAQLASVGIDPAAVRYTNICKYRPPANDLRAFFSDSGVPNDIVYEGLVELKEEIEAVGPAVIVPLGNYPTRMLTGKGRWKDGYTGIGDWRGSILVGSPITGGRKCVPSYHPASCLREYKNKHILRLDLAKAKRESSDRAYHPLTKRLVLDPTGAELSTWVDWLLGAGSDLGYPRSGFISADIEYTGTLWCIGFTRNSDVAITIDTRSDEGFRAARAILESGIPLCFQNAMFDCSILAWHYNIDCFRNLGHDPMAAMHVAYTEFPKDLGFIGSIFTDQPFWKDMVDWKRVLAGTQPMDKLWEYNAIDTWVTHSAMEQLLDDELKDERTRVTYEFEMSLIQPLWDIAARGVPIDTARLNSLRTTLSDELTIIQGRLNDLNGGKLLNVKSGPQVAKFIYDTLGCPPKGPRTPKGAWKMDDTALADLLLKARTDTQREGIKLVRAARERRDLTSKFCDITLDADGRMRCHYDPTKTQTGRLSSRAFAPTGNGSNLQNVPRDPRVRAVFVPDRGCVFGYADLKSAESLVVAHITGDPEMLRLHSPEYMDGTHDGHKYVASLLLEKPIDQITKDDRYLGKRVRHAGNYGLSWFKLMQLINADAQTTGVSVDAARAKLLISGYRKLHPFLEMWWRDVQSQLYATHTIYTTPKMWKVVEGQEIWQSRPHIFYGRPNEILPNAIAQNPQGTVADTLNIGLMRAADDGELRDLGFKMLLQVHDAIGFQVPEAHASQAALRLLELMKVRLLIERKGIEPYEITIPVEMQIGYNWGEATKDDTNPNGLKTWTP